MPRNTTTSGKWTALLFALVFLLTSLTVIFVQPANVSGYETKGTLDAWIEGQVVNGEAGMKVTCQTLKQTGMTPPQFITLYFNGTTDASGGFNISVDSDTWGSSPALNPYTVVIHSTYYKEAVTGYDLYTFSDHIFKGNTSFVPDGELLVSDPPTCNMTVRVINGTSGEPLEGALVELGYRPGFPEPPFSLVRTTDAAGETVYPRIRSVNTSVEITEKDFQPLSETDPNDFMIVPEGGEALSIFTMTEKEWPFSVLLDSVDVNHSLPIRIDFKRTMHRESILNVNNYGLFREAGMLEIPFGLTSLEDDTMIDLQPLEDLEFDTTYNLRIEPYIMDALGARPLWRAMTVPFTTELPPGAIIGRLVNSKTGEPADGLQAMVLDQISFSNEEGTFIFPSIPAGSYRLEVNESYLYNGTSRPGCVVEKGKVLDLGDVPIGPKSWGTLRVGVASRGSPFEGARVRIVDDMIPEGRFDLLTGPEGEVFFPKVVAGAVTLEVSAPHHSTVGDMAYVPVSGEGSLDIVLKEDPFPLWVEAVDVDERGNVLPGTNFVVHVSEPIRFSTLNVTIWKKDDEGLPTVSVPLSLVAGQDELTYIVDPDIRLPLESRFVLMVSTELKALDDASFILWRELEFHFNTADLPMILVNGTLLF
ncbi:MAG: carboxypeptidase regulatory-like domain-containing protein, partial [Candidatus Thermoplasmatota archaeon]|nr:carboxypeptidase regulatory-like domain-containing protein [Candidatus Thermoplasmatota archaeon]